MATSQDNPIAAQAQPIAPVVEQLPQAGGSYIRLADGSLQPAPAEPSLTHETTTPQE